MSSFEKEGTGAQGNDDALDDLWGAEGGSEASVLHGPDEPAFDNSEARDTLSESLEDPVDAIPRDPGSEPEPAPKKNSSLPFYGAVGAFVFVAAGLVAYKTGLVGGSPRKPIEPAIALAIDSTSAEDKAKKPDGMLDAASASKLTTSDLFGESGSKAAPAFDAEADLLADKGPAPVAAPTAPPVEVAQPATKAPEVAPEVVAQAPATTPAPAPAAIAPPLQRVKEVPKGAPVVSLPVEVAKATPKADATTAFGANKTETPKPAKPVRVAAAPKVSTPAKASAPRVLAHKSVHVDGLSDSRKPPKASGQRRRALEKDSTPESKEVLAGWKLRGTWPSHGPSQLAWVADEQGRLTTVSVGAKVAGARVLAIGKRGELVQTSAGLILP
ncbi:MULTISPECIES: hypothetical protein [unclassified Variovorax]|uniref:hypothetical protein n=1 Tax=unclassified Variovorax TaxID=663243 RepID=UPI00076D2F34|nr:MULTISPECIES: hypothetical protein [unclassified Variovorax]KWT65042.1 hypothetical protein APY03_7495 [Variovorax sp. WDL1]PNG49089.1 hypothetical protein CHC06_06326 [Variovorax sp. B2]PNG49474.1 hypothetical protein CHC07_06383 [Variovorax sp. B4]VTV18896.1 hypothetical protein WDL1P2_00514 [Variovorax sp. WDL1]